MTVEIGSAIKADLTATPIVAIPTIVTERLILRPHRLSDFDDYTAFWSDRDVVRFIGGEPSTREQSWARMMRYAGMWHFLGFGFLAIEDRATGCFIGEAGFLDMHREMNPTTEGTIEAGWALTPSVHGRGYATEAVSALIGWAQSRFAGRPITCIIEPENAPSLRVAEKLGFRETGLTAYQGKSYLMFER